MSKVECLEMRKMKECTVGMNHTLKAIAAEV